MDLTSVRGLTVVPAVATGKFAYVVNLANGTLPGTVSEDAIGAAGELTLLGTVHAGLKSFMIATSY